MEGIALFASFAILMNFPRRGLLKNVGQIITWSIRDESLHSEGVCAYLENLLMKTKSFGLKTLKMKFTKLVMR